jgi:hypothetical protein
MSDQAAKRPQLDTSPSLGAALLWRSVYMLVAVLHVLVGSVTLRETAEAIEKYLKRLDAVLTLNDVPEEHKQIGLKLAKEIKEREVIEYVKEFSKGVVVKESELERELLRKWEEETAKELMCQGVAEFVRTQDTELVAWAARLTPQMNPDAGKLQNERRTRTIDTATREGFFLCYLLLTLHQPIKIAALTGQDKHISSIANELASIVKALVSRISYERKVPKGIDLFKAAWTPCLAVKEEKK